ncbi:MAG: SDR family NAD(P)-dependent oxidoreductase [Nanohaloarchaea archaeon]|nr:SDR family NAD(P)-dependent oxidoreductase [Candidatus Nanohaloarchaea archaeon]
MNWTADDLPDLKSKKIIVTGANSGLGFEAAKEFVLKGATVIMACRNMEKAEEAAEEIKSEDLEGSLDVLELDLASLKSIESFAEEYRKNHNELHVLCNNAGVMAIPRKETENGFEYQFGVNHLGHFALTSELVELLEKTEGETRVVNQSSGLHESGSLDFDDLMLEDNYDKWKAYGNSKLANILFTKELDRRLKENDLNIRSVACHPGYASTNLQYKGPEESGSRLRLLGMKVANSLFAQSAAKGALPMLYASTSPDVQGGEYIGPGGFRNMRGYPEKQQPSNEARDLEVAEKLWNRSEDLTGKSFNI